VQREDYRALNVTAVYPDMEHARKGVEALEVAGVDADDINLGGRAAERAATPGSTTQRDGAEMGRAGRVALGGIGIGALVGALLGLVAGYLALDGNWQGILAMVVGFAAAGAGVGLQVSFMSRQKQSQSWEETFDDTPGEVVVEVHTDDRDTFDKAVEALGKADGAHLRTFDAQGNDLPG